MTTELVELFQRLRKLKRVEKLHVIQFLESELAQDEASLIQPGLEYPVWSPYDAFDAENVMLKALSEANLPYRPGQLVEVLVSADDKDRDGSTRQMAALFKETQALPQVQQLTDAEIAAEIAAYRNGL